MNSTTSSTSLNAKPILGCVADDVTGATDLAINLVQGGMRVIQWLEIPTAQALAACDADAVVIALKTRSIDAVDAQTTCVKALEVLRKAGCKRFFFKYCSTFDSTRTGNIGPVAEAMMVALGVDQTVFCPAFPKAGRTVYQGHLFVGDKLLSESGLENHPLNPMDDANLVRFLGCQTTRPVGLLCHADLQSVDDATGTLASLRSDKIQHVVTDCCHAGHLEVLAAAVESMPLVTGGSGIARYLPDAYRATGILSGHAAAAQPPQVEGREIILSGSCSPATNRQVVIAMENSHAWQLSISDILANASEYRLRLIDWATNCGTDKPLLVYSTAQPNLVRDAQQKYGQAKVATAIEDFLGSVARILVNEHHVRRIVVAGGETSGAVVRDLGIKALRIGPEICTGVPWTESEDSDRPLALALKSGNFGDDDFFHGALEMLR